MTAAGTLALQPLEAQCEEACCPALGVGEVWGEGRGWMGAVASGAGWGSSGTVKEILAKGLVARCSSTSGWKRSSSASAVWYTPRCTFTPSAASSKGTGSNVRFTCARRPLSAPGPRPHHRLLPGPAAPRQQRCEQAGNGPLRRPPPSMPGSKQLAARHHMLPAPFVSVPRWCGDCVLVRGITGAVTQRAAPSSGRSCQTPG